MEEALLKKIDEISDEMISGIKRVVQIDSVQSEAKPGMPFGEGVNKALEEALKLARELGFETENVDHMVGIAKYGQGEDYIGIMGHLDVVPVGEGWNHPPFSAYEDENGRIFARGILDNKGPTLSCLYALYAIKELKIQLKRPVYILFGTNEETGFEDLTHFLKVRKPPIMGWTPDCKYPVVYAERGRSTYRVSAAIENNLRVAKQNATMEEIEVACKKANIHEYIQSLPNGYKTMVEELGSSLSGGERQRMGLARMFLHDAKLVLLDEPTSNLDSLNEGAILKSIYEERKDKTIVFVSHRESTLSHCDRVIHMESERVS